MGSVARIIDRIEDWRPGTGRLPVATVKDLETLRFFAREGVPWREWRANAGRACGPILRRRRDERSAMAVRRRGQAALIRSVRSGPEIAPCPWDAVADGHSVRAKRGGEPTGPDPTDRGKVGTKHQGKVSTDGRPPAVVSAAANAPDRRLFPHRLRWVQRIRAAIGRLYADAGCDGADDRRICPRGGNQPRIRKAGEARGSGLGTIRCVVERGGAWSLAATRSDRRRDGLGRMSLALLTTAGILVVASRSGGFRKRYLRRPAAGGGCVVFHACRS
jgi:hypothetical protein